MITHVLLSEKNMKVIQIPFKKQDQYRTKNPDRFPQRLICWMKKHGIPIPKRMDYQDLKYAEHFDKYNDGEHQFTADPECPFVPDEIPK